MKNDLRIDFTKNEIIMSRNFEKCASIVGSEEYRQLQLVRQDYPHFAVVRRQIKKAATKVTYAGLIYAYMEHYIATQDHAEEIRKIYDELRLIGACHKISYPTIKKWFLETYPEIEKFSVAEENSTEDQTVEKKIA